MVAGHQMQHGTGGAGGTQGGGWSSWCRNWRSRNNPRWKCHKTQDLVVVEVDGYGGGPAIIVGGSGGSGIVLIAYPT